MGACLDSQWNSFCGRKWILWLIMTLPWLQYSGVQKHWLLWGWAWKCSSGISSTLVFSKPHYYHLLTLYNSNNRAHSIEMICGLKIVSSFIHCTNIHTHKHKGSQKCYSHRPASPNYWLLFLFKVVNVLNSFNLWVSPNMILFFFQCSLLSFFIIVLFNR